MRRLQTDLLRLHAEKSELFDRYAHLLLLWNQKINLTAITDRHQIEELHFIDSISVAAWLREEIVSRETFRILDIGAGGGFPGIPIKIIQPTIELTLVDSVRKKCDFMKEVVRSLSLKGVTVLHDRVDTDKSLGQFDFVVSRAAFKLRDLMAYAQPNLEEDGILVAMKSMGIEDEMKEAASYQNELGFGGLEQISYKLPYSGQERQLIIIRKSIR